MSQTVYITSYVKGPVRVGGRNRVPVLPWVFRISDRDLCDSLRRSPADNCRTDRTFYQLEAVQPPQIKIGDLLLIENGNLIRADGVVRKDCALVDESAVTGDSTLALRESGGNDRVMRDSVVMSGAIVIEVTPRLGHALDWISNGEPATKRQAARLITSNLVVPASKRPEPNGPGECTGK